MNGPALSLHDVHVVYDVDPVVEGVSLDVAHGEWLGLIGPNGAGKSSLLRAVAGLIPHGGTIGLAPSTAARQGTAPGRAGRRDRARRVALVPQSPVVPPGATVAEYVLLGRTPHISYFGVESRGDRQVVAGILRRLGLAPFAGRRLDTLSGGERQRVVIARALAQQAPVLLLDEPTNGLDVGSQQEVMELIAALCVEDGLTVVSAMHDLTLAGQFADRLAMISAGRLAATGTAEEVLTERGIGQHYGASVRILRDEDGSVIVIPTRVGAGEGPAMAGTGAHPGRGGRRGAPTSPADRRPGATA